MIEFLKIESEIIVVIPDGAWEETNSPLIYSLFPSSSL